MSKFVTISPRVGDTPAHRIRAFYEMLSRDIAGGEPADVVVDRYHTGDVVQVSDGLRIDRERLVTHITPLRKQGFDLAGVEVHEALAEEAPEGWVVAARMTLRASLRRREVVTQMHLFARFARDGRLRRAHVLTRVPEGGGGADA